jgi:hypothetical protein
MATEITISEGENSSNPQPNEQAELLLAIGEIRGQVQILPTLQTQLTSLQAELQSFRQLVEDNLTEIEEATEQANEANEQEELGQQDEPTPENEVTIEEVTIAQMEPEPVIQETEQEQGIISRIVSKIL